MYISDEATKHGSTCDPSYLVYKDVFFCVIPAKRESDDSQHFKRPSWLDMADAGTPSTCPLRNMDGQA